MTTFVKGSVGLTLVDTKLAGAIAGPSFRSRRLGPEWEMVERFLSELPIRIATGCDAIVFQEPRLPSGFPDLVIVIWDRKKAARWRQERATLTTLDLRLAHYIYQSGPSTEGKLRRVFARSVSESIERLNASGILRTSGARWLLRPLSGIFAARQIIAVEAKVSKWKAALRQAELNTWFASVSYILVPEVPRRSLLLEMAGRLGIGVWTKNHAPLKPRQPEQLPRSYVSWLFNEWAWRASARTE